MHNRTDFFRELAFCEEQLCETNVSVFVSDLLQSFAWILLTGVLPKDSGTSAPTPLKYSLSCSWGLSRWSSSNVLSVINLLSLGLLSSIEVNCDTENSLFTHLYLENKVPNTSQPRFLYYMKAFTLGKAEDLWPWPFPTRERPERAHEMRTWMQHRETFLFNQP